MQQNAMKYFLAVLISHLTNSLDKCSNLCGISKYSCILIESMCVFQLCHRMLSHIPYQLSMILLNMTSLKNFPLRLINRNVFLEFAFEFTILNMMFSSLRISFKFRFVEFIPVHFFPIHAVVFPNIIRWYIDKSIFLLSSMCSILSAGH